MRSTNDPWGGRAEAIVTHGHNRHSEWANFCVGRPVEVELDPPGGAGLCCSGLTLGMMPRSRGGERGAALVLAIGVLAILIVISLTFWQATRQEMKTATNTANSIRAELLTDGAFAIAIAFLNHDLAAHPSYTSLDHAWRTYFNGSWAVGKPWLWADGTSLFRNGAENGGVPGIPEVNRDSVPDFGDGFYIPRIAPLVDGGGNTVFPAQYAQGYDSDGDDIPDTPIPFAVSSDLVDESALVSFRITPRDRLSDNVFMSFGMRNLLLQLSDNDTNPGNEANDILPDEQIHFWTDVDNDGDGLNDSIWLPIGGDVIFDADGLDNDLDGRTDEPGETAVFLYFGGDDGLDNDGNGLVDDAGEGVFLTVRIEDGQGNSLLDSDAVYGAVEDAIDNNFDLMKNGVQTFVFDDDLSENQNHPGLGYHQIAPQYLSDFLIQRELEVYSSGETVTEIVGRVAILITDEASKVNINAAGGLSYEAFTEEGDAATPMTRSFNEGIGPHEYELRVLPGIGRIIGPRAWLVRMGAPQGGLALAPFASALYLDPTGNDPTSPDFAALGNFGFDVSLPGYGRVDDNGNALALALNGIDDDGDGLIDEGINVQSDDEGIRAALEALLGRDFEGLDEPGEFQRFRPLRNRIAETDSDLNDGIDGDFDGLVDGSDPEGDDSDNDGDGVFDEIGELGDRFYRTHEQIKLVNYLFGSTFRDVQNFITAHSQDRNDRHLHRDDLGDFSDDRGRRSTGPRLDYNVARAREIADALHRDWRYPRSQPLFVDTLSGARDPLFFAARAYALGLRREDTTVITRGPGGHLLDQEASTGFESIVLEADASLRSEQLGVSIKDFADRDFARSELTSKVVDDWWVSQGGQEQLISYTVAGIESIRINEIMVRPVRRFEAEAITNVEDPAFVRDLDPNRFTPTPEGDFRMRVRTMMDRLQDPIFSDFEPSPSEIQFPGDLFRNEHWFRYYEGALLPNGQIPPLQQVSGLPLMGLRSAYTTYQSYITAILPDDDEREFFVPDVVQFSFQATDGLPPGRYYLKLNTEYIDVGGLARTISRAAGIYGAYGPVGASATHEEDLAFIFKIGLLEEDILNDIVDVEIDQVEDYSHSEIVIVDDDAWRRPAVVGSELLGGSRGTAFLQADNVNGASLAPDAVADSRFGASTGFTIEVPEIQDAGTEDLWLHVAVRSLRGDGLPLVLNYFDFSQEPDHEWVELVNVDTDTAVDVSGWELAVEGGDRLIMTIPEETFIAPGGMLLLGTNKYDFFEVGDPESRGAFFENGMGLARGSFGVPPDDSFAGVTVPRTRTLSPKGSVFVRDNGVDFVDRNGDGAEEWGTPDDDVVSTEDLVQDSTDPTKAWDRIVELFVPTLPGRLSADAVGEIVLAGGIFPNRPEYDGLDNDLDNGILNRDLIDNDGDGIIDGSVDEGVDEGRYRRELFDRDNYPVPGAFNWQFAAPLVSNTDTESSRWKEFVERRFFPGDNVIITLYEGSAYRNRVVDRVTYNQRDIENSAIDDVIRTTYGPLNTDGDGFLDNVNVFSPIPEPLDPNYTSFWPGNTMGVDFYRSLERKHPLYSGDRFGTQNRFTATDGNYDDWADSTGRWERVLNDANRLETLGILDRFSAAFEIHNQFSHAFDGSPLRMNATQRYAQEVPSVDVAPFDPGFYSAQLARKAMFEAADARNRNIVSAGDLLTLPHISKTNDLVTLRQFGDPAAAFLFDVDSPNVSFAPDDPLPVDTFRENLSYNQALLGQNFDIDDPQDFFRDTRAVIGNAAANSSIALSVGQAEVFLLGAGTVQWGTESTDSGIPEAWVPVLLHDLVAPDTGLVSGVYQRRYLMQTPSTLPSSVRTDRSPMESRAAFYVSGNHQHSDPPPFPDPTPPFDPTRPHVDGSGAESLFVWDGDDGLENGEYILYLVMGDDLRRLRRAHLDSGENLLTTGSFDPEFFGADFVQQAVQTAPEERIVDVEVFTDKNGDRRVWTDLNFGGPQADELNNGDNLDAVGRDVASETFGLEAGLEADASGVIRYGVVRVENNYLAVMLRNWSDAGSINMFSRVILAPRDKTPGRININTVQTRRTGPTNNFADLFNPLHGLPGILARPNDDISVGPGDRPLALATSVSHVQQLARHIVQQRQRPTGEAPDGRYYELTSDLLADEHGLPYLLPSGDAFLQPPLVILEDDSQNLLNPIALSTNDRVGAFREGAYRFSRMQNLITTRSDVFEILVTVQAGYGTDANGDGRINYRDDREFTATAEKSARTVYER